MNFSAAIKATTTGSITNGVLVFELETQQFRDIGATVADSVNDSAFAIVDAIYGDTWRPVVELPKIDGSWASAWKALREGYSVRRRIWSCASYRYGMDFDGSMCCKSYDIPWRYREATTTGAFAEASHTDWEIFARETPDVEDTSDDRIPSGMTDRT